MKLKREDEPEPIDEEIIKKLMDLRSYLEERVQNLEEEAEKLRALFKMVEELIVSKSFKRAETIHPVIAETVTYEESWETVPIKTSKGVLLANMYVSKESVRIVPTENLVFTIDTPPFKSFFLNRVLESMQTNDREESNSGKIPPEDILSYEVLKEGDTIREIKVKNYRSKRRLMEITSTSRWTLEKMYEKTLSPS